MILFDKFYGEKGVGSDVLSADGPSKLGQEVLACDL
jgi:hypothetical protein